MGRGRLHSEQVPRFEWIWYNFCFFSTESWSLSTGILWHFLDYKLSQKFLPPPHLDPVSSRQIVHETISQIIVTICLDISMSHYEKGQFLKLKSVAYHSDLDNTFSVFPRGNSWLDICPAAAIGSRTFVNMDRTIVLQLLVTVGHFETATGNQYSTFILFQLMRHISQKGLASLAFI